MRELASVFERVKEEEEEEGEKIGRERSRLGQKRIDVKSCTLGKMQ